MRLTRPHAVASDSVVSAVPVTISGVVLTPAAAASTLILYDNASAASGTVLVSLQAAANGSSVVFDTPVRAELGVYADIGGAAAAAYVYF